MSKNKKKNKGNKNRNKNYTNNKNQNIVDNNENKKTEITENFITLHEDILGSNVNDDTIDDSSLLSEIDKIEEAQKEKLFDDKTKYLNLEEVSEELKKREEAEKEKELDLFKTNKVDVNEVEEQLNEKLEDNINGLDLNYINKQIEEEDSDMSKKRSKKMQSKAGTKNKKALKSKKNDNGKKKSKNKKQKSLLGKIIVRSSIVFILLLILVAIGVVLAFTYGAFSGTAKIDKEDFILNKENSKVYNSEGKEVAILADDEKRQIVSYSDLPEFLPKAYVAIEDERFFKHNGVDFKRTIGAIAQYILKKGSSSYGASTITQQLIKNVTDDDERTWKRKVREINRALELEKNLTKEQILELYLNIIFVGGEGIHGVALASDYYFSKPVDKLTIAEAAFLAGINHMPNHYNPFLDPNIESFLTKKEIDKIDKDIKDEKERKKEKLKQAKEKRNEEIKNRALTVLGKMKELGKDFISDEQYNEAVESVKKGFKFKNGKKAYSTLKYSYITDAAIEELTEAIAKEKEISRELARAKIYNSGYKIYTTEITKYQKMAEKEMKSNEYLLKNRKGVRAQASITVLDHKTGEVVAAVGGLR